MRVIIFHCYLQHSRGGVFFFAKSVHVNIDLPKYIILGSSWIGNDSSIASNIALIFGVSCIGYTVGINPTSKRNFVALGMSVLVAIYALSDLNISQLDSLLLLLVLAYFIYIMSTQPIDSNQIIESSHSTFLNLFVF